MRVLVAPDKFRGSMTAAEAAAAMVAGVRDVHPDAKVIVLPLADGGEGTVDALCDAVGGTRMPITVMGPLGAPVSASWALLDDGTAVVELAAASGAGLLAHDVRDPMHATTYGTGELIRAALRHDPPPRRVVVALGGSATNDGGAGVLEALGVRAVDGEGNALAPGGAALRAVAGIDLAPALCMLGGIPIVAACDVDATLIGPRGASVRFGPQKGASAEDVERLDAALLEWGKCLERACGARLVDLPGVGAAGGTGAALAALGATLVSGASLVLDAVDFDRSAARADLILTGEGRIDAESATGKVVGAVARRAAACPVLAFAGAIDGDVEALRSLGVTELIRIGGGTASAADLARGAGDLRRAVAAALRRRGPSP